MTMMRFAIPLLMLVLALPTGAARAQSATGGRLDSAERRLNALDPQPAGATLAQAGDSQRLDAIERRLDALETRLGVARQAQPSGGAPPPAPTASLAAPGGAPAATAPVQLPSGAVQHVPAATAAAAAAVPSPAPAPVQANYRSLGLRKGMTEAEVIQLLGPPVKVRRGMIDVLFYGNDSIEPNVNLQYGRVVDWHE